MTGTIIAAGTRIAAEAGVAVAERGGNAVDAAIAATVVSMCTDTGIMSPGAGAFISVWPARSDPVVVDGYVEMPGRGLPASRFGQAMHAACFDYGGEMRSLVGYGSVATPGAFAGLADASRRYGRLSWQRLIDPAIAWAERGFPLTGGAAEYLRFTHRAIYSWHRDSYRVLHRSDGSPLQEGDTVRVPHLADSLRRIAETDAEALYGGELGGRIGRSVRRHGGMLGSEDLRRYRSIERTPTTVRYGEWIVATNPPPAVGGVCLAAMLLMLDALGTPRGERRAAQHMVAAQRAVLDFRARRLDGAGERLPERAESLLRRAGRAALDTGLQSPSTTHVSAVDSDGLACAITASAGYGSGAMVSGTGLWLNNSLGEIDLHPEGLAGLAPGTRLASNMAPTIARRADGAVIAIGSPGASRITTAIVQTLYNFVARGMALENAVSHPRLHVELGDDRRSIAFEPGLPVQRAAELRLRPFAGRSMYFGGVQAALWSPAGGLAAVADDRRGGSVATAAER